MATVTIQSFRCGDNYVFIPACCYSGNQFDASAIGGFRAN